MNARRIIVVVAIALAASPLLFACEGGGGGGDPGGPQGDGGGTAVRAAQMTPIAAVFTEATFSTKYNAKFTNPDLDELSFDWSGSNCGYITIAGEKTCTTADCQSEMSWVHPHPPCSASSSHTDTTIVLTVTGKRSGKTALCTYRGAETGTGPACGEAAFGGSELGPDSHARIVYRATKDNRCTTIQLVQVVYFKTKAPPEAVVVPHNAAMDDPGPNMMGYLVPALADDKNGYVVDKNVGVPFATNDPYYPGTEPGSPTEPAVLEDRPGNTKKGHKSFYEVCALCSATPADADYGKYLDCITWELDGDTGRVTKTEPQPTAKPTPGFVDAVALWNQNHSFKMPGAK